MFSSGPDLTKLKTNLRLSINRLKLLEKKKTENGLKARKEIADYLQNGKDDRARIRVEHIVREDYYVEAMELVEMYCDLLLARFGLIQTQKELDPGLEEAIATLIWVSPRMQADVIELKCVGDILAQKYGKEFAAECRQNRLHNVSEKVMHKMSVQAPPKVLVEKYLCEIARSYNIPFDPDPILMQDVNDDMSDLINLSQNGSGPSNNYYPPGPPSHGNYVPGQPPSGTFVPGQPSNGNYPSGPPSHGNSGGGGGFQESPGFSTGLMYPYPPNNPALSTYPPSSTPYGASSEKPPLPADPPVGQYPAGFSAPPSHNYADTPPSYTSMVPEHKSSAGLGSNSLQLPDIPPASSPNNSVPYNPNFGNSTAPSSGTDVDFDDLSRRFDQLKKRK